MRQSAKPQVVEKLDPVWDRMRSEAEDIARKEPVLGGFIFSAVLNHNTFEKALVHRLAQRLGNVDLSADLVVQAFEDAIEEEPEIGLRRACGHPGHLRARSRLPPLCRSAALFQGLTRRLQTHRMAHRLLHMGRRGFCQLPAKPLVDDFQRGHQSGCQNRQGHHDRSWP